jgi:hypothetical protein
MLTGQPVSVQAAAISIVYSHVLNSGAGIAQNPRYFSEIKQRRADVSVGLQNKSHH